MRWDDGSGHLLMLDFYPLALPTQHQGGHVKPALGMIPLGICRAALIKQYLHRCTAASTHTSWPLLINAFINASINLSIDVQQHLRTRDGLLINAFINTSINLSIDVQQHLRTRDDLSQLCGGDGELVGEPPQPRLAGGAIQVVVGSACPPWPCPTFVAGGIGAANFLVRLS